MARRVSMDRAFEAVGYKPHDVQREIHAMEAYNRFIVACAGRRTGKSHMGGHRLTVEAIQAKYRKGLSRTGKRAEFWIVGPEYTDGEKEFRVLYNDILKLGIPMDKPGTYYNADSGQMDLSLWGGGFQVHVKSAKYPNSLVGEALEGVILAEAAKLKPSVWIKFIRPMLADFHGWAFMSSTPEGKNWFYDVYKRGQDPADPLWGSKRAPSWCNNLLFPLGRQDPEILDMSKDMSEEKFKQEIGAEFTEFVGRVFKRYETETHIGDYLYNPKLPLYIATDYGFTNPNVALFIQVDVWDNVYVIGEYYERGRTSEEFATDLDRDPRLGPLARAATRLYGDPEDPGASTTMSEKFGLTKMGSTGGSLTDRLNLIRRWLKAQPEELEDGHAEKLPKLFFDRSCHNTDREMNDYRYPDTLSESQESRENPKKVDDHAPEALGRFFAGHFAAEFKPKRRARQSQARIRR